MWLNEGRVNEISLKGSCPFVMVGGGKPDMTQAGGPDKAKLTQALEAAYEVVARKGRQ